MITPIAMLPEGTPVNPRPAEMRAQPQQDRSRDTIAVILEATTQVLSQERALTVTRVAERAGVAIGTFYRYFSDRQMLLQVWLKPQLPAIEASFELPADAALAPAALKLTTALCAWWTPPRRTAWSLLDDATRFAVRTRVMTDLHALVDTATRAHGLRQDPYAVFAGVAGALGALGHALTRGDLEAGSAARVAEDLALLLIAPLVWPAQAWRAACQQTDAGRLSPRSSRRREPPIRRWMRLAPRQGRAAASVASIIEAAGRLLERQLDYTVESLAHQAGVSVSTVYRYFGDKRFAMAEFGVRQLAGVTERLLASRSGIYLDAPGAGVERLVRLPLDPLRSRLARTLLLAIFEHGERRVIDEQINYLCTLFAPSVLRHPLCGIQRPQLALAFHAIDGVAVWLTTKDGLVKLPDAYEDLVEATARMIFVYCAADRPTVTAVLDGARPLCDLRKPPGRPEHL